MKSKVGRGSDLTSWRKGFIERCTLSIAADANNRVQRERMECFFPSLLLALFAMAVT